MTLTPTPVCPCTTSFHLHPEFIARVAHEANRMVCVANNDHSQPPWEEAPDWQRDSALLGVRKILSGEITSPGQSHQSWLEQKQIDGWIYGLYKDPEKKTHPCMVPFASLPVSEQIKDYVFLGIVKALAPYAYSPRLENTLIATAHTPPPDPPDLSED